MDNEKLIQDYIANRLPQERREYLETLLKTNTGFKAEYEDYKTINSAFLNNEAKALKEHLKNIENSHTKRFTLTSFINSKIVKATIACVLIIGLFYFINPPKSGNELYESYFETCANTYLPITRSENQKTITFKAFQAYENNDFKISENIFSEILKTTDNPNIEFFYVMSLLNQNKTSEALQKLQKLNNIKFDYQVESLWYTVLIQVKNEDFEKAKNNITLLQKLNPDFKTEEVESILKDIL